MRCAHQRRTPGMQLGFELGGEIAAVSVHFTLAYGVDEERRQPSAGIGVGDRTLAGGERVYGFHVDNHHWVG